MNFFIVLKGHLSYIGVMQFSFIYSSLLFRPVDNVLCMMFTTTLVVLYYADIRSSSL